MQPELSILRFVRWRLNRDWESYPNWKHSTFELFYYVTNFISSEDKLRFGFRSRPYGPQAAGTWQGGRRGRCATQGPPRESVAVGVFKPLIRIILSLQICPILVSDSCLLWLFFSTQHHLWVVFIHLFHSFFDAFMLCGWVSQSLLKFFAFFWFIVLIMLCPSMDWVGEWHWRN